jgi:hypothetical protein
MDSMSKLDRKEERQHVPVNLARLDTNLPVGKLRALGELTLLAPGPYLLCPISLVRHPNRG